MTLPTSIPLNEHTRNILGRPCFACIGIAQLLRDMGHTIARKAEDEQAAVAHWCLNLYLEHGEAWVDRAQEIAKEHRRELRMAEGGL